MRTCSTIRLALLSSLVGAITLSGNCTATALFPPASANALPDSDREESDAAANISSTRLSFNSPLTATIAALPSALQMAQALTPDASPVAASDVRILSPQPTVTGARTTNLVVQYAAGTTVQVTLNGKPLDSVIPTQTQRDEANQRVTQVWYNILLQPGENTLTVQPAGGTAVSVTVTVQEVKAQLQFLPSTDPRVPADGRSSVTLEGQILDDKGQPIAQDATVTLTASAGTFVGADQDRDRPGFQVLAREGKFTAQLQSNLAAQKVRVRAAVDLSQPKPIAPDQQELDPLPPTSVSNNGRSSLQDLTLLTPAPQVSLQTHQIEAYTQVEFITNLRSPIVSGVINLRLGNAGTDFYSSFRDFLRPSLLDDGTRLDVDAAIFGTGRLGNWLITGALNNQRPLNQVCDGTTRLFRDTQFCDQVYPVFGDSSTTDYLTPSIDSVYLRLERTSPVPGAGSDFFMWGDYTTSELSAASQYFTATNRQLHGFKGNYNFGNFQFTAIYGNNLEGFQRDTIAPNGTSGYYFLSRRLVLGGSEIVTLETEELARPGSVIERKQLARGVDYEIDYDRGAILFRRPVLQTEFDLFGRTLVRRIVATYQYESDGSTDLYAGRLQYNFSRGFGLESWAAVSYLNEDQSDRSFELYGVDLLVPIGENGRLIGEIARSTNTSIFRGDIEGTAYRLEFTGPVLPGVLGRAYYRSVDENFSNNATFSFTPGQTRYGAELSTNVARTTQLRVQYDHEENFGIASSVLTSTTDLFNPDPEPVPGSRVDNELTTIRAGVLQKFGQVDFALDWVNRTREDRISPDRLDEDSNQIVSRLTVPLAKTLAFRAQNETNLGDSDPLYPDRTTFGLDWNVFPGVTVRLAQQFLSATSQIRSNSITSLDTIVDHRLSEDTTVTGRYSVLNGVSGFTSQGALGLNHRIRLSPGLRVNLAYERIFGDIFAYTAAGQQFAQPYATGQSAASLGITSGNSYSVGMEYTDNPDFKASARFDYRDSSGGDGLVISAGAAGKVSPSLTALVRYQQANYSNQLLAGTLGDTINLKVGLAYRNPVDDKFNALLRYEYRQNPSTIPDTILEGSGSGSQVHLFALEAIYAPNYRWEFYGKFALRNTRSYTAQDLVGTNAITLGQLRATYRLGYRWDIGGEVRWIGQSLVGYDEVGFVLEAGYYLTPNLRVAAGYVFGDISDRDFGDRSEDSFYVGLSFKVNELFNGWGLQPVGQPQQQESRVTPVSAQPAAQPAPQASPAPESPPTESQPTPESPPGSNSQPTQGGQSQ